MPDVAVVVVHYRTPVELRACLDALRAQRPRPAEILVVDNSALVDGATSRPAPGEDWEWVRSPNVGYAAGCNVGVARTDSPLVTVLNADVTLEPDALSTLRARLLAGRRTFAVGPRLWDPGGSIQLSARSDPGVHTAFLGRSSTITRALRRRGHTPAGLAAAENLRARAVDWVSGACQMFRRDAFARVGGFDERFWMYWEDADLCRRLREAGGEVWYEPAAQARHSTGASGRTVRTVQAFHASAARFYEKHLARSRVDAEVVRALLRTRAAYVCRAQHGAG
ncbi:MAG TPA: glycosyltransferase family 2 protein [Solirubrobacteraceae bacterium]|nr:glycosyltransferase family 2 protein [Solirubrobacteraceae bacterium]